MKKIIYIKTIELLVIDGIMLAFLTFKEGLTWDWILIYSGWLIFFHPVLLTYLSNQLCDHFSQLYSQIRARFWRFALQILLWDSLMIPSLKEKWDTTFPSGNSPHPRTPHPFLSHKPKSEKRLPKNLSRTDFFLEYFMIDKKNQAGWAWSFLSIFSIKDNGDWSVIDQLNLHIRSKNACLNGHFLC